MRRLIYSMTVSLDGFIADAQGEINWTGPDDELFRFHYDRVRELGLHLCGRRLYEAMLYWETADQGSLGELQREFAHVWQALPKIVFSTTLQSVEGNATLRTGGAVEEVANLKREPGGDIEVGGAGLASVLSRAGLIDEYQLFISPVVLGGGTPFFPTAEDRIALELVETRMFSGSIIYARYRRAQ